MKKLIALAIVVGGLALGSTALGAGADSCLAKSTSGERVSCSAATTATKVAKARVKIGDRTDKAAWVLNCTKGSRSQVSRGKLGLRKVAQPNINLPHPTCTLK